MYRYFVFVTKDPFGEPDLPLKLHFPDSQPQRVIPKNIELPVHFFDNEILFAIPNLRPDTFKPLRLLRNMLYIIGLRMKFVAQFTLE
jgi:hypothetical protein